MSCINSKGPKAATLANLIEEYGLNDEYKNFRLTVVSNIWAIEVHRLQVGFKAIEMWNFVFKLILNFTDVGESFMNILKAFDFSTKACKPFVISNNAVTIVHAKHSGMQANQNRCR